MLLVDLAGHSAGNRLLTFARRPAPVQVAYLLGHGYSTGLSAMDAFLADAALAPDGADALFSERLIRLPRIPLAYAPPDGMPPVAPLPALDQRLRHVRPFRPDRAPERHGHRDLGAHPACGAAVAADPEQPAIPGSRHSASLFLARFAAHGIEPEQGSIWSTRRHSRAPGRPMAASTLRSIRFPHNAGTTTIEALWQGVPVVSLAGRPTVGRFGASILHAVGLDDWVADDTDAYVARAVAAASDLASLAHMRAGLRQRVAGRRCATPLGLARAIEATYRMLWDEWREGDVARLHRLYTEDNQRGRQRIGAAHAAAA